MPLSQKQKDYIQLRKYNAQRRREGHRRIRNFMANCEVPSSIKQKDQDPRKFMRYV